jgi:hypothetical protein
LDGFGLTTVSSTEREFEFSGLRLDGDIVRRALAHYRERTSPYLGEDSLKIALAYTIAVSKSIEVTIWKLRDRKGWVEYLNFGSETEFSPGLAPKVQIFYTTTDSYMGISLRRLQLGDRIRALFGGKTLFLLKPIGENIGWVDFGSIKELKVGSSGLYIQGNDVSAVKLKQRGKTRDFLLIENHRLVGECCVQGLVGGEALAILESGEVEEPWFDVR